MTTDSRFDSKKPLRHYFLLDSTTRIVDDSRLKNRTSYDTQPRCSHRHSSAATREQKVLTNGTAPEIEKKHEHACSLLLRRFFTDPIRAQKFPLLLQSLFENEWHVAVKRVGMKQVTNPVHSKARCVLKNEKRIDNQNRQTNSEKCRNSRARRMLGKRASLPNRLTPCRPTNH